MAKKVVGIVNLRCPAGKATTAPPVGPALGQYGVNISEFVKTYNERTAAQTGTIVPVEITIFEDRTFSFVTKTPTVSDLIKKAAGVPYGSSVHRMVMVAKVNRDRRSDSHPRREARLILDRQSNQHLPGPQSPATPKRANFPKSASDKSHSPISDRIISVLAKSHRGRTVSEISILMGAAPDEVSPALTQLALEGRVAVRQSRYFLLVSPPAPVHEPEAGTSAEVEPAVTGTLVQQYRGWIDLIEEDTAYLTLEDDAGHVVDAEYASAPLLERGFTAGDRLVCEFFRTPSGIQMRFNPQPRRELTEEELDELKAKWERVADAF